MQINICLSQSSPCLVSWRELRENIRHCLSFASRRCSFETQDLKNDRNCSRVTPVLEIGMDCGSRELTIVRSENIATFATEPRANLLLTCSGCPSCLRPLDCPNYTLGQYDFRKGFIRLIWELTDVPLTVSELKMGSISQIRELLKAASLYAAEVGDAVSEHDCTAKLDED